MCFASLLWKSTKLQGTLFIYLSIWRLLFGDFLGKTFITKFIFLQDLIFWFLYTVGILFVRCWTVGFCLLVYYTSISEYNLMRNNPLHRSLVSSVTFIYLAEWNKAYLASEQITIWCFWFGARSQRTVKIFSIFNLKMHHI